MAAMAEKHDGILKKCHRIAMALRVVYGDVMSSHGEKGKIAIFFVFFRDRCWAHMTQPYLIIYCKSAAATNAETEQQHNPAPAPNGHQQRRPAAVQPREATTSTRTTPRSSDQHQHPAAPRMAVTNGSANDSTTVKTNFNVEDG